MPKQLVSALPSRYDVPARRRAREMLENRLTLLSGGGGVGGRINHAAGATARAPASANTVREERQTSVELIPHPIPPSRAAPDYPFFAPSAGLVCSAADEEGVADERAS